MDHKIGFPTKVGLECYFPHELRYLRGDGDVTHVYIKTGNERKPYKLTSYKNLKYYEKLLNAYNFIRVCKNSIIYFAALHTINIKDGTIMLGDIDHEPITLSDHYRVNLVVKVKK